ncbi:dihydroneopterin aldolase [Pantoea sp. Mhis]|uniref:dihydroneopterin aldolase n=1 Tax=Pantoea sp. Mhis TaxID=2576759 RepID=UPI0013588F43|nr:dihydroneopterin aldolase [Pantoea sp. Mhis]MXP56403.1 dihydroneopterin aldolase [Pantoea sp. Mhis]
MDILYIEQLIVFTKIGIYDWEQRIKQKLLIDIEMEWKKYCSNTNNYDINQYLNYETIADSILIYVQNQNFTLIEHVAEKLANLLISRFHSSGVRIKVSKPGAIAQATMVGVRIERGYFV